MVINLKEKKSFIRNISKVGGDFFKNLVGLSKHPKKTLKKLNFWIRLNKREFNEAQILLGLFVFIKAGKDSLKSLPNSKVAASVFDIYS